MNVLLLGCGAREHALAWKVKSSKCLTKLYMYPLSPVYDFPGSVVHRFPYDGPLDHQKWPRCASIAKEMGVDLVISGPEAPLVEGAGEAFRKEGILFWGPSQDAAQLEGSKAFAKKIMKDAGIPSAEYLEVPLNEAAQALALEHLRNHAAVVLKASGLAQGKGVFVCHNEQAVAEAFQHLTSPSMKDAAKTLIIEECLQGRECSYFTLIAGNQSTPLGFAVDFKRLLDGDLGPNTGGMGAYTPVPWLPENAALQIEELVISPLLRHLSNEKIEYTGTLYVGLMWTESGPKVIEFNVRFGDPEAQVLCYHDDRDWLSLIMEKLNPAFSYTATASSPDRGNLVAARKAKATVGIVLAAEGYPYHANKKNIPLSPGLCEESLDGMVFFGGIIRTHNALHATKGRVCTLVCSGESFEEARQKAYAYARKYAWKGAIFRTDIAAKVCEGPL